MKDVALSDDFRWHSSFGMEFAFDSHNVRISATPDTLSAFNRVGSHFLIHKTEHSLWRLADDGQTIEKCIDDTPLQEIQNES